MTEKSFASISKKRKTEQFECQICGCQALYTFYGVLSCQACKVFFKRNAHLKNSLKCSYDHHCEILPYNRHLCAPCRLSKCFDQGMRIEMIRRYTFNKTKYSTSNILLKSNQIPKVNHEKIEHKQ